MPSDQSGYYARFERFPLIKAVCLALIGCLIVPASFFEAVSQLPSSIASPIQVPLLTTPTIVKLSRKEREKIVRGSMNARQLKLLADLAAKRLEDEPLDASALWLWSVPQGALLGRRALDLAEQVSLRETSVQMELMRLKALDGNLTASLVHLDNGLLVSYSSGLPILQAIAKGLDNPELVRLLKPYGSRPWYKLLVEQAVYLAPQPENAVDLLSQSELSSRDLEPELIRNLLSRLVSSGRFKDASSVAKRFAGLTDSALVTFAPTAATTFPDAAPLTWTFSRDPNVAAKIIRNGVYFDLDRGLGGALMTRVTNLPAGNFTLRQAIEASTPDLSIRWEMQCLTEGQFKTAWSQSIPATTNRQVFDTKVKVDVNCTVQRWELFSFSQGGAASPTLSVTQLDVVAQ